MNLSSFFKTSLAFGPGGETTILGKALIWILLLRIATTQRFHINLYAIRKPQNTVGSQNRQEQNQQDPFNCKNRDNYLLRSLKSHINECRQRVYTIRSDYPDLWNYQAFACRFTTLQTCGCCKRRFFDVAYQRFVIHGFPHRMITPPTQYHGAYCVSICCENLALVKPSRSKSR